MNKSEIIINKDGLYINNYIQVIDINCLKISVKLIDKMIIIYGDNLIVSQMDKYDILIKGNIKGIELNNEK